MRKHARLILIPAIVIIVLSVSTALWLDYLGEKIEFDRTSVVSSDDILTFIWAAENFHGKVDQERITMEVLELAGIIPSGEAGDKWTRVKITNGLLRAQSLNNNMGWLPAINEPTAVIRTNIEQESGYLEDCFISLGVAWDRMYKMDDAATCREYIAKALKSFNLWREQRNQNKDALNWYKYAVELVIKTNVENIE
jgi:hypothetical protein